MPRSPMLRSWSVLRPLALAGAWGVLGAGRDVAGQAVTNFDVPWRWVDFGPESGLPEGAPLEMADADTLVWVRTSGGVAWYDGFRWRRPTAGPDSLSGTATSLVRDADGVFYLVHGGRLFRGDHRGFSPTAVPGLDGRELVRAVPLDGGDLLASTSAGVVWRVGSGTLERQRLPGMDDPGSLWRTDSGEIWVDTRGGFFSWDGEGWRERDARGDANRRGALVTQAGDVTWVYRPGAPETRGLLRFDGDAPARAVRDEGDHVVYSVAARSDGLALVVYESGDVRRWDGSSWDDVALPAPRDRGIRFVRLDEDGDFWFGTDRGLRLFRSRQIRWTVTRRPFPALFNRVNAITVTHDTTVWIGTGDGIMRHKSADVRYWQRPVPDVGSAPITGIAEDTRGVVWASSGSGFEGVLSFDGRAWRHLGPADGFDVGFVHRVSAGPGGAVWMASLGRTDGTGAGVWRLDAGDPSPRPFGAESGIPEERVYAALEDTDGTVWVGGVTGLSRVRDGELRRWTGFGLDRFDGSKVWDIALDSLGLPWMAINPDLLGGVAYLDADDVVHRLIPPGPPGARKVWSLLFDEDGALWMATEAGLLHYEAGIWTRLDESSGLPASNLWPLAMSPASLLIGTKGAGMVTLNRSESDTPPPLVVLESATAQDRVARIRFSALSYWGIQPHDRIETRYRVDGGDWSAWGTEREPLLAPLSAGRHSVEIQAKGLLGALSPIVTASIQLPYPLVLRPAFAVPVGGLLLTVLLLGRHAAARRTRHEEEIREREQRLRTLLESAPEAIGIYDVERRRFIEANRNALELFALSEDDLDDVDPSRMTPDPPAGRVHPSETFLDAAHRAANGESAVFDWTVLTRAGEQIPCEIRLTRLPSAQGTRLRASLIDTRERLRAQQRQRELEEQLRQSQKLEAVGQLTGGIAHDFNNLLTVIRGNLELLAEELRPEAEARELLDGAVQAAERSASLTQRLLAFSRRQALSPGRVDLPALLEGLRELLRRSLGEAYRLDVRIEDGTWAVDADRSQLESAIVNLALNARDAMPGGGTIVVETTNVPVGALDGLARDLEPIDYVRLSVIDTGVGMDPEVVERAFDPFFTTKDVGKGTGLGLSMVYGYVAQSGGTVRIDSVRGEGTCVAMYLPRAFTAVAGEKGAASETALPRGDGQMILVVEDDRGVGALVSQFLDRLGYEPVVVENGDVALRRLRDGLAPAALITDMVLPGALNGEDLAAAARRERPGLPVLFMSGYAEEPRAARGDAGPQGEILRKPFDLATLARKLRRTLVR